MQVENELTIHRELCHDNIVHVYAIFASNKRIYMVQEYAAGGSISKQRAEAGGYLLEPQVDTQIIAPLLSALQYLHSKASHLCS